VTVARRAAIALALLATGAPAWASAYAAPARIEIVSLRGVPQTLHLYGAGDKVAIVTSGDGGWMHLGPDVAALLAEEGYRVIGFDAKAYLASFTSRSGPLHVEDVPADYEALVAYAAPTGSIRPLLIGVSEGAGLSVLAATAPAVRARIAGVVVLGLPDRNELGWRFRDSIIYLTKKTPDEPTFSVREIVSHMAPLPLAAIHSRGDEFVPLPEVQGILDVARDPKRLWLVDAADHRFTGARPQLQQCLAEAIAWVASAGRAGP